MSSKLEHVETSIGTINSRLENAIQKGNETLKDTLKELLKEMKTKGDENRHIKISRYQRDEIKNNIESIKKVCGMCKRHV